MKHTVQILRNIFRLLKKEEEKKTQTADKHTKQKQRRRQWCIFLHKTTVLAPTLHAHELRAYNSPFILLAKTTPFNQKYGNNLSSVRCNSFTTSGRNLMSLSRNAVSLKSWVLEWETPPLHWHQGADKHQKYREDTLQEALLSPSLILCTYL